MGKQIKNTFNDRFQLARDGALGDIFTRQEIRDQLREERHERRTAARRRDQARKTQRR